MLTSHDPCPVCCTQPPYYQCIWILGPMPDQVFVNTLLPSPHPLHLALPWTSHASNIATNWEKHLALLALLLKYQTFSQGRKVCHYPQELAGHPRSTAVVLSVLRTLLVTPMTFWGSAWCSTIPQLSAPVVTYQTWRKTCEQRNQDVLEALGFSSWPELWSSNATQINSCKTLLTKYPLSILYTSHFFKGASSTHGQKQP